jgi:hypothetical protein
LEVYNCTDSDVVLGLYPANANPTSIDLAWSGGGIGAWTLRGFFRPVKASGPQMAVWFLAG